MSESARHGALTDERLGRHLALVSGQSAPAGLDEALGQVLVIETDLTMAEARKCIVRTLDQAELIGGARATVSNNLNVKVRTEVHLDDRFAFATVLWLSPTTVGTRALYLVESIGSIEDTHLEGVLWELQGMLTFALASIAGSITLERSQED